MRVLQDNRRMKAFTLVELTMVVLILGILAFVAVPRIGESSTTAKVNACTANIALQNKQVEIFYLDTGAYPDRDRLKEVSGFVDYFPDGLARMPFRGRLQIQQKSRPS